MTLLRAALVTCAGLTLAPLWADPQPVPARQRYERLLCVVPMTGTGTAADPKRPLLAPTLTPNVGRRGVFGYSYQLSDDQQFALVEFLATDPRAFAELRNSKQVLVLFERGKSKKADIERELKRYKHDFQLDHFGQGVK